MWPVAFWGLVLFLFLFFPISRREKLPRIKDPKSDHNLAFSLQDDVLELLEQLSLSPCFICLCVGNTDGRQNQDIFRNCGKFLCWSLYCSQESCASPGEMFAWRCMSCGPAGQSAALSTLRLKGTGGGEGTASWIRYVGGTEGPQPSRTERRGILEERDW